LSSATLFNYRYFLARASSIGGRILDYGCGRGEVVAMGRAQGLDVWGADTYSPHHASWLGHLEGQQQWHYPLWDVLMFQVWPDGIDGR
jgi:hypothetical protein